MLLVSFLHQMVPFFCFLAPDCGLQLRKRMMPGTIHVIISEMILHRAQDKKREDERFSCF